ncbi:MAG TPA: hypothetical protein VGE55_13230 [Limnobacter sp.]|uniref:hypothetical protein n=1 Tax=Limnobacter sp. TaxID=2003368 RepID=UPI002ED910CF
MAEPTTAASPDWTKLPGNITLDNMDSLPPEVKKKIVETFGSFSWNNLKKFMDQIEKAVKGT